VITVSWLVVILAVALVAWAIGSYSSGGIIAILLAPGRSAADKVAVIQEYFDSFGIIAPLVYVGIVTIEVVVAPIPGLMLYAPGGVIFGGFLGGLLSLLGMAPQCWTQAYLADGVLRAVPQLLYPLLILCGIYAVVVVWVILFRVPRLRG
jgi:hypothetical protein